MADSAGKPATDLMEFIQGNVTRFSFYQLVSLLEQIRPTAPIGGAQDPSQEKIRFVGTSSVAFPNRDINEMREIPGDHGPRLEIEATFMGLTGSASPLPTPYLEEVLQDDTEVLKDFLDLFNHRLMSLTYRSWKGARLGVQLADDRDQPLVKLALALMGFDFAQTELEEAYPTGWLMRWAGLLAQRPRSAHTLQLLLRDAVHPKIVVEQGAEREVQVSQHLLPRVGSAVATLGQHMFIGQRIKDRTGGIRVWLGPVSMDEMLKFTPGEPGFVRLKQIVELVVQDYLDYEITVVVPRADVYSPRLGGSPGPRLHVTAWVGQPNKAYVHVTIQGRSEGIKLKQSDDAGLVAMFVPGGGEAAYA